MRKVIGIGETVLDIIFKNEKPVEAVPGGSTFNSVVSLGRAGDNVTFISETGDDRVGAYVRQFLSRNNVSTDSFCVRPEAKTPLSLAFLDEANNADYVFYREPARDPAEFSFPDIAADDIVVFGSFYAVAPASRPQVSTLLEQARQSGAIIYYDVNFRPAHRGDIMKITPNLIDNLEYADIVRGSHDDFMELYRKDTAERVYRAETSFYCPRLVYTDGSHPVTVYSDGGFHKEYAMPPIDVVSTIGAGDNFNAGIIHALLKNNIRRADIERGLSEEQWDNLIATATAFSANCCQDIHNYISEEFGRSLTAR